jgi:hypothetical protein
MTGTKLLFVVSGLLALSITAEMAQAERVSPMFTMSDVTAFTIALGAFVAAVGAVIVNIIAARAAARKVAEVATTVAEVNSKTDIIKTSVDGAASMQKQETAVLRKELEMMRSTLAGERAIAEKLAIAAATALVTPANLLPATPMLEPTPSESSLASIDESSKEIVKNTATSKDKP